MNERLLFVFLLSGSLITSPAWSQSNDIASERSRVADERIRIEAERMAQEEQRRAAAAAEAEQLGASEAEQADVIPATVATSPTTSHPGEETTRLGMSLMLEHLDVLGQLRDSGYVTEAEFERIKQRILDGEL